MIASIGLDSGTRGLNCKTSSRELKKLALLTVAGTWRPLASRQVSPAWSWEMATIASGLRNNP
ncbi:hypothetical protein DOQ08_00187 [Marinobacter litoralis]|uniref:Uncharacterized protein n=1 Tax=Marinobacter litoralis TaxID=187981 RepID=A0A3M2RJL4_9GAMM|nr:hypothetical protein DOQ08_00187 [Marinobacter litoralis]